MQCITSQCVTKYTWSDLVYEAYLHVAALDAFTEVVVGCVNRGATFDEQLQHVEVVFDRRQDDGRGVWRHADASVALLVEDVRLGETDASVNVGRLG